MKSRTILCTALAVVAFAFVPTAIAKPTGKPVAAVAPGPAIPGTSVPCPKIHDWSQKWDEQTVTPFDQVVIILDTPGATFFDVGTAPGFTAKMIDSQTILLTSKVGRTSIQLKTDFVKTADFAFHMRMYAFNGNTPVNEADFGKVLSYNGSGRGECANCGTGGTMGYGFSVIGSASPLQVAALPIPKCPPGQKCSANESVAALPTTSTQPRLPK